VRKIYEKIFGIYIDSICYWRRAGDDKDNQDFFDTTLAGLITAVHAERFGK
jgi:hypothetical protein